MTAYVSAPPSYLRSIETVKSHIPTISTLSVDDIFIALRSIPKPEIIYTVYDPNIDRFNNIQRTESTSVPSLSGNFVTLIPRHRFIATQTPHRSRDCFNKKKLIAFFEALKTYQAVAVVNLTHKDDQDTLNYTGSQNFPNYLEITNENNTDNVFLNSYEGPNENVEDSFTSIKQQLKHAVFEGVLPPQRPVLNIMLDEEYEDISASTSPPATPPKYTPDDMKDPGLEYLYVKVDCWVDRLDMPLEPFVPLISKICKIFTEHENKIIMVHCLGGVGRTGTLIVACAINQLFKEKILNKENRNEIIASLVLELRMQRSPSAVQNEKQMKLLFAYADSLLSDPL